MKKSTKINRNYYRNLRKRFKSHNDIMNMIQPHRVEEFYNDIAPIMKPLIEKRSKISLWKKLLNIIK
jgi:hypothetical protein